MPGANIGSIAGNVGVARQESTNVATLSPKGLVIDYRGLELRQEGFLLKQTVAKQRYEGAVERAEQAVLLRDEFPKPAVIS